MRFLEDTPPCQVGVKGSNRTNWKRWIPLLRHIPVFVLAEVQAPFPAGAYVSDVSVGWWALQLGLQPFEAGLAGYGLSDQTLALFKGNAKGARVNHLF